jgi:glutathione S-transferase
VSAALAIAAALAAAIGWWAWESSRRRTHPVPAGHRPEISLPWREEFELYHNALSLCSMKTRVCLAELGIPYRSHPVDLIETGCYENIRRRFLAVNPGGTVPVLVHCGHPVYESHEQIRYAAAHAPSSRPALRPADPAQREEMERWIDRSSLTEDPLNHGDESAGNAVPGLTLPLFAAMIERIATWRILEGLLFHFDRRRPLVFLSLKLLGLGRLPRMAPAMRALARSRRQMAFHLDALEKQLGESGGPWILGEDFSLADVGWLVIFERLAQADCLHVFVGGGRRARCAAYWARLQARAGYRAGILEHGHPTIRYGTQRLREAKAADPALREALEGPDA